MNKKGMKKWFLALLSLFTIVTLIACGQKQANPSDASVATEKVTKTAKKVTYKVSEEEKAYLANRFAGLTATNPEAIAYVYAPGTNLDEPVVQTTDNATYLDKTFDGGYEPFMGTVFMDTDNNKMFSDSLTWLFGHARGSTVPDHRMFNDVNYYDDQAFFDAHPYVVIETPERKYYYEAAFMIIVPEDTAFYRTAFDNEQEFEQQLTEVRQLAHTQNPNVKITSKDKYVVLSTCREDDETIRANLYLRQIPDSELTNFLANHGEQLAYQPTR